MDHHASLVKYVQSRRKDGASVELIINGLVLNGWSYADAQNAVASVIRESTQSRSKFRPLVTVLIVLLSLAVIALSIMLATGTSFQDIL